MSEIAPNTLNYMVGKGKVYFDRLDGNENPTGELDLGNDPTFALNLANEDLVHYSSMEGVKKKDKSAIISTDLTLKFTLDEINVENLVLAMFGDAVEYVTQGDGNAVDEAITARHSRWVKLDYRKVTEGTVVVTDSTGAVTYTLTTDYTLDLVTGRIFTVATGAIADGEALLVDYTYEEAAYPAVYPATNAKVEGLLRFIGDCTFGFDYEIVLWKVKLSVSGDIGFIGDDWAQIEFTGEVLDDSANHPNNPYGIVIDIEGDTASES